MRANNISKDMAMGNKDALIDCVNFLTQAPKVEALPDSQEFDKDMEKGWIVLSRCEL